MLGNGRGLLSVDSAFDRDKRCSRTSLVSIFEDHLVNLRRSVLRRELSAWSQKSWVEKTFHKRECCRFIPSSRDPTRCCCGRMEGWHTRLPKIREEGQPHPAPERWHPIRHTTALPTDAYGTIEFQGAPHPSKAQYLRLSSIDSRPENVVQMLTKNWGLELPKLLITVHGGLLNFELQPKLKRVFRKGLLKAARTTGAWIITNGTNTGVTKHVGDAISDRTAKTKNKVVAIGIAPWGIVERKEDLIGRDVVVPYHCVASSLKVNSSVLNSNHGYFLLADNGTVGKYGGEIIFRRKLEKYIAQQKICMTNVFKGRGVPVISVVLEGGANTVRAVLEYVTDSPPVPVVICDGSGRAADLLAFAHKYTLDDGTMPESLRDQLIMTIQKIFQYTVEQAEKLFIELMLAVKKKELITVFRMGEGSQDIDLAILTALLKGTNASAMDQLNLVLAWDRVDIARSHIFVYGQEWPEGGLEQAMMDALINDRVDFVKLLLENGVSMHTFLTIDRLEELYNTKLGPTNTLKYLIKDVRKHTPSSYRYTLLDIGLIVQHLMGGAFRSSYCRRHFRQKYYAHRQNMGGSVSQHANLNAVIQSPENSRTAEYVFEYPFHDLMIWAVLMKRQRMALFMWQHGEEAMAKALVACKLYRAMAHEADQDDLEIELSEEFRSYSTEFQVLALELLEHCYKLDDDYTQQLLTYEIKTFSEQTNLSLAVAANHRQFIAHTGCQVLLNDLWIGGLRMRKNSSLKVMLGIIFPPYLLALEFKSREELQLMPQTMEEHLDDLEDNGDTISERRASVSSIDESQDLMSGEDIPEVNFQMNTTTPVPKSENGNIPQDTTVSSGFQVKKKKSQLKMGKKIYEFYNAPVTKFCLHTIGYLAFLCIFMYTVLKKLNNTPEWQELYVMAFIATLAVEKVRQIIASEPVKVSMKLRMYCSKVWNIWDTLAILLFAVGVVLRCFPSRLMDAQVIYVTDIVLWNMRILEILSVNQYLGPYVKIIAKLVRDMAYYLIILFIVVTSYGVVRQVVQHQNNKDMSWSRTLRNVWFYPYWMIYGELFAEEIDPCETGEGSCSVYASWVAPASMCIYLLVANILGVNLLIARFNATFIRNNAYSRQIWMFQRYQLIIEYEMRPFLPPPMIIMTHLYLAMKYVCRRCKGKRDLFDNGLKLFLSRDDTEKLHDFEEECMEDFFREKELKFQSSSDERIRVINERVETMSLRLEDLNSKESSMRLSMQTVDYRLSRLEEIAAGTSEILSHVRTLIARQNTPPISVQIPGFSITQAPSSLTAGQSVSREDVMTVEDFGSDRGPSPGPVSVRSWQADNVNTGEPELQPMPSPMLVHSQKPVREDHLRRFTNYSHSRQLSGESFSRMSLSDEVDGAGVQGEVQQFVNEPERPLRATVSDSSAVLNKDDGSLNPDLSTSLQQRRSGMNRLTLDVSPVHGRLRSRSALTPSVRFQEPVSHASELLDSNAGPVSHEEIFSQDHIQSSTATTTPRLARLSLSEQHQLNPAALSASGAHYKGVNIRLASTPISPDLTPLTPPHVITSANAFTTPDPEVIPSAAVRDLVSVFTHSHGEYSTITDNIDVSCFRNISPPRSPVPSTTNVTKSSGSGSFMRKRAESITSKVKEEELMEAEETERLKMEGLIRHRLRQISQDDSSGSISDIARLVVSEMEMNQTSTPPEESDAEDIEEEDDIDSHDNETMHAEEQNPRKGSIESTHL